MKDVEKNLGDAGERREPDRDSSSSSDDDCFFESLDRVPSGVSFAIPSSSSDEGEEDYDDVRFSFASAMAPPSAASDDDDDGDFGHGGYDYGIWMAEPMSVKERRHRLLEGMGFASSKDMPAPPPPSIIRAVSRRHSRISLRFAAPTDPILPRSRSDPQGLVAPAEVLRRSSSAPSSLLGPQWAQKRVGGGEGAPPDSPPSDGVCRIKNLDTGKEFVVSELAKDGTWGRLNDLQTGLQLTLEEFERCNGYSPIVKELMRRVNLNGSNGDNKGNNNRASTKSLKSSGGRRKRGWLKNIKFVASSVTGLISERDRDCGPTLSMRRSNSARGGNDWLKVHQHGKSYKELTGLYMCQKIEAHRGSIWCIKFRSDSRYLASAGEDRVVHVWQVLESESFSSSHLLRRDSRSSLPPLPVSLDRSARLSARPSKRTRKGKISGDSRRSSIPDYIVMPEIIYSFVEKPVCSFQGHLDDVLDLSWSKSQYLLSSSMDKTVRLWDMESKSCLKLFAHNDYVTCIQFNPVDDRYFISGSLDAKVRIWSIPDRQVVDWSDLHEMVTAVCYTPDGQGALVGSHKGSCRFYNTSDCKLNQVSQIDIRNKKKKSQAKKITGFQFAPGNPSEVLITSADSQIRIFDGVDLIHKFRGFRNTSSQISASFTTEGRFVVCASEDSHVYVWKRDLGGKSKGLGTTRSHEHFYCKDVSVAIPWPNVGPCLPPSLSSSRHNQQQQQLSDSQRSTCTLEDLFPSPHLRKKSSSEHISPDDLRSRSGIGASSSSSSSSSSWGWYNGSSSSSNRTTSAEAANAWGLVVVTAGLGGDIKIYQNFGLPLRLSRQTNLF